MNVVLTRERGKNDALRAWTPPDAMVVEVPLTSTTYVEPDEVRNALEATIGNGRFRSLVVTSERSAAYVEIALQRSAPDVELFVVGLTTSRALFARGIRAAVHGEGSAETLAPQISRGPVLLLGAKSMRTELPAALRTNGLEVEEVACYETVPRTLDRGDEATLGTADVLFIGAPSAWMVARAFVSEKAWVVVPGASTGAAVRGGHVRVIEGWGPELKSKLAQLFATPAS